MSVGAQQVSRPTASIRGVVVQSMNLQPVAKAVVRLSKGTTADPLIATTGADGRFEFQNVAAGTYDLTASRSGYLVTEFGQRGPSGNGSKLTIEAGSSVDNVRLVMTATGTISGRVSDNSGDPLANVPVQALKYSYADGQRTLTQVKVDQTDDRGEFRLFWLPPGQYYISAQPLDGRASMVFMLNDSLSGAHKLSFDANGFMIDTVSANSGAQKPGEAFVPVYYPGTADPQSASRVEVRPGNETRGIDFILNPVTTRKVRGTVINGATGQLAEVANVQLVPRGNIGTTFRGTMDRGKFEVGGVLPGAYFLVATARMGAPSDVKVMGGRTIVDVGYSDLDNISVTIHPTIDIAGRVTMEGRPEGLPPGRIG